MRLFCQKRSCSKFFEAYATLWSKLRSFGNLALYVVEIIYKEGRLALKLG